MPLNRNVVDGRMCYPYGNIENLQTYLLVLELVQILVNKLH